MIRHDGASPTSAALPYYGYGAMPDEPVDARALTKIVSRYRVLIAGTVTAISGLAMLLALNMTRNTPASPASRSTPRRPGWSTRKRFSRNARRIAGRSRPTSR